jgi:hypothetical protein
MTGTDIAVTTAVARNRDGPDLIDLDRLAASLDYLGLCWGEPDTVGATAPAGRLILEPNNAWPFPVQRPRAPRRFLPPHTHKGHRGRARVV